MGYPAKHGGFGAARTALAALLALGLCACGAPENTDRVGRAGQSGPRIVSLNPCLDAILVEVADPSQILALSHYSRDPVSSSIDREVADQFAITGGTAEEIVALQPDLVLASTFIAPSTKSALERLGVAVETFGSPTSLDESLAQIERLAKLAERTSEGKALEARIMRDLPTFSAMPVPEESQVSAMLWQPGQIVAGEASLVWEHLGRFGLANHGAKMGLGQADHIALEAIVADPPDLLLVAGDSNGQTHPLLSEFEQTRVARFEPKLFYCGGPSMPKAWKRLEAIRLDFVLNPPGRVTHDGHRHAH